jgi:hypothetical protein
MTTRNDHRMKSFARAAISPATPCIQDGVYAGATVVGANRILEKPSLYALEKKP